MFTAVYILQKDSRKGSESPMPQKENSLLTSTLMTLNYSRMRKFGLEHVLENQIKEAETSLLEELEMNDIIPLQSLDYFVKV